MERVYKIIALSFFTCICTDFNASEFVSTRYLEESGVQAQLDPEPFLRHLGYPLKAVERRVKTYKGCSSFSLQSQLLADMIEDRDLFRRTSEKGCIPYEFFLLKEACDVLQSYKDTRQYSPDRYSWDRSQEFISNPLVVEAFIVWVGRGPGTEMSRRLFAGLLLHMAAHEHAPLEIAQFALARGANIDTQDHAGRTPLMIAIKNDNAALTDILVEHGADYNATDHAGKTAFVVALECGKPAVTEALLDRGACISGLEQAEDRALHIVVEKSIDETQSYRDTAILLIKRGADSNSVIDGRTPLLRAIQGNNYAMAKVLLDHGARSDLSVDGISPLRLAYLHENEDMFRLLMSYGFRDRGDSNGETVLHTAVKRGDVEVVRELLQTGANPNSITKDGWTPLAEAAKQGYTEVVHLILNHGGWKLVYHKIDGKIAQDIARENGHNDIFGMLGGYY